MAAKLVSIDPAERVDQREVPEAVAELRLCITDLENCLDGLAKQYPGAVGIGAIVAGGAKGVFVMTGSRDGVQFSTTVAEQRMRSLAKIIGHLPGELRSAFEVELAAVQPRQSAQQDAREGD